MDEQSFFAQAKGIRLTRAEAERIGQSIRFFAKKYSVRAREEACLTGNMDQKQFFTAGKAIHVPSRQADRVWKALERRMQELPVQIPAKRRAPAESGFFAVLAALTSRLAMGSAFVFTAFITLGSVSYAAQSSVPGDPFYAVKVHINEPILERVSMFNGTHGEYRVKRTEERFREFEQMAAEGRLDEQTKMTVVEDLRLQVFELQEDIAVLEDSGQYERAADLSSRLEVTLGAHSQVLEEVALTSPDAEEVQQLLDDVQIAHEEVAKVREDVESRVIDVPAPALKETVVQSLEETEKKIEETRSEIARNKPEEELPVMAGISAQHTYAEEELSLQAAEDTLEQVRENLRLRTYPEALKLSKQAERNADRAAIISKVREELQLPLVSPQPSATVSDPVNEYMPQGKYTYPEKYVPIEKIAPNEKIPPVEKYVPDERYLPAEKTIPNEKVNPSVVAPAPNLPNYPVNSGVHSSVANYPPKPTWLELPVKNIQPSTLRLEEIRNSFGNTNYGSTNLTK